MFEGPSRPVDKPIVWNPSDVPFVGWSRASHEFRKLAAEYATSRSVRPLIMGDNGVGRRTMARAWEVMSGGKVEFLEYASIGLPSYHIGVTGGLPPRGRYVVLLDGGSRGFAPPSSRDSDVIETAIYNYFGLPIYVPPISPGREIDVLAFLDYWNRARSPFVGIRYKAVALSFLRRMAFGGPRADNLEGVYKRLRMLNHLNRPAPEDGAEAALDVEVETLSDPADDARAGLDADASEAEPGPEEGEIPFDSLPDLAVRLYLWACQNEPPEDGAAAGSAGGARRLPPGSLRPFTSGLAAGEFLRLTEEQFLHDHVLPGISREILERPDRLPLLKHRVRYQAVFGTTFEALQEGLRVDPVLVEGRLRRAKDAGRARRADPAGSEPRIGGAASVPATPPGWTGNRFAVEETTYHIVFWEAGKCVERGRFPLGKNFGIDYYHRLVHRPDSAHSAQELEAAAGRMDREAAPSGEAMTGEAGFSGSPSKDPIFDKEGKKAILRRIGELRGEIDTARRRGDEMSLRDSEGELKVLVAELSDAMGPSGMKNLDPATKRTRERVRKAMDDARAKLTHNGLPGLAAHLKERVRFKEGKWSYLPPRSMPPWEA